MEHRDQTGPMVFVNSTESKRVIQKPYLPNDAITWRDGEKPSDAMPFRVAQLEFRRAEVYTALKAFSNLVEGEKGDLELMQKASFDWASWKHGVSYEDNVIAAGHSFGAATMVSSN